MIHDHLLRHLAVGLHDHLVDLKGCLDGVRLVVDPFELFEGAALGLDAVEWIGGLVYIEKGGDGERGHRGHRTCACV